MQETENLNLRRCVPPKSLSPWWREYEPLAKWRKIDSADARMGDVCPAFTPRE